MGAMACPRKDVPGSTGDEVEERLPGGWCGLVEFTGHHEGRHRDGGQSIDDAPVAQCADHVELVRAVHRVINRRLRFHLVLAVDEVLGSWSDPADVPRVENLCRLQVFRVRNRAIRLMTIESVLHLRGQ